MQNAIVESVQIGPLSLKNRIVMAPETGTFSPGNVPSHDLVEYSAHSAENYGELIFS